MEKLIAEYDVTVEWVNFPLHPETPAEGMLLLDLFGGESARPRLEESHKRLSAIAEAEGLPMTRRDRTYNSRLAQELGSWATQQGKGTAFHDAAFRAYFAESKDISNPKVLLDLATGVGLDREGAEAVLTSRTQRRQVDLEWARSHEAGVTGVPTFIAGGQRVVGAQPYSVLEQLVVAAGAKKRPGK